MVDRRLEPHDSNQLELKLAYAIDRNRKRQRYRVETYMFVPKTLGLNSKTYPAERFYEDTTGFIRLKTPTVALASLAQGDQARVWFEPLAAGFGAVLSGERSDTADLIRQLKILGCIYRRALRDEGLEMLARFDRLAEHGTVGAHTGDRELAADLSRFGSDVGGATGRLRKLGEKCEHAAMPDGVREVWRAVDEYVAIVSEDVVTTLVETIDERVASMADHPLAVVRESLADLAIAAYHHRRARDYPSYVREGEENENLTHRRRLLKRIVASSLYLNIRHEDPSRGMQDIIGMIAAAGAMLFAVWVTLEAQEAWPDFGAPFIAVAVISYMIKDRIKEWGKRYLAGPFKRFIPDHAMQVRDHEGRGIGHCKEAFELTETSALDPEIMSLRHMDHPTAAAEQGRPESVIRYTKEVTLSSAGILEHGEGISALTDIVRFNLGRLRRRMDEPYEPYRLIHPEERQVLTVRCARVYHVNFILRITTMSGNGQATETERVRVVVDQRGIKRIEHVTPYGTRDAIERAAEPTADLSELD